MLKKHFEAKNRAELPATTVTYLVCGERARARACARIFKYHLFDTYGNLILLKTINILHIRSIDLQYNIRIFYY